MTTNNHPAHGPVSLDRLHQISEILSKAAAQSDGGNLGYAMADAVKVIDEVLEARNSEPVGAPDAWLWVKSTGYITAGINRPMYEPQHSAAIPLYAVPSAPTEPVVPDEYRHLSELYHAQEKRLFKLAQRIKGPSFDKYAHSPSQAIDVLEEAIFGDNEDACRAAMLQAGNSPAVPDGLSTICAEAYQVVGVMAEELGMFDSENIQKCLDNLSQQKMVHNDVLPFSLTCSNSPVTPDTWITVSERMPPQGVPLLVCSCNGVVQRAVYGFDGKNWLDWYEQYDPVKAELDDLWQPLPAAPKQEGK